MDISTYSWLLKKEWERMRHFHYVPLEVVLPGKWKIKPESSQDSFPRYQLPKDKIFLNYTLGGYSAHFRLWEMPSIKQHSFSIKQMTRNIIRYVRKCTYKLIFKRFKNIFQTIDMREPQVLNFNA
jgi:hypothetical protein